MVFLVATIIPSYSHHDTVSQQDQILSICDDAYLQNVHNAGTSEKWLQIAEKKYKSCKAMAHEVTETMPIISEHIPQKIVCGEGTVEIDNICQVKEIPVKEIPVKEIPVKETPVKEIPAKKSGGFFEWIFNLFSWNVIEKNIPKILIYNCAENYDKVIELGKNNPNPKGKQYDFVMFEGLVLINGLNENRCFITVESWAFDSDYEDMIWASDWRKASWYNQLVLGEVEPNNKGDERDILNYQVSKKALDQTDNYADYVELMSR